LTFGFDIPENGLAEIVKSSKMNYLEMTATEYEITTLTQFFITLHCPDVTETLDLVSYTCTEYDENSSIVGTCVSVTLGNAFSVPPFKDVLVVGSMDDPFGFTVIELELACS
jgi:hypothetical protein